MYVLDASALLAYLNEERGGEEVEALLDEALISTVNLSEVLQKVAVVGVEPAQLAFEVSGMGVRSVAFDAQMAIAAARLWPLTKHKGLSLADRACLALAEAVHGIAVTADTAWAGLDLPSIDIHIVSR